MPTTHHRPYDAASLVRLPLNLEPQSEGGFTITSPLIPEFLTEADTLAEVMPNVLGASETVVELYEDFGRSLPTELFVADSSTELVTLDVIVSA